MTIDELCNMDVVCCDAGASVAQIASLMREHHVGDVVVVDGASSRIPVGIVTDRDIVVELVAAKADLDMFTAGDIMTAPLSTVKQEASLGDALELMQSLKIRRVPVVREDGALYGIITADDVVRLLSGEMAFLAKAIARQTEVEWRAHR